MPSAQTETRNRIDVAIAGAGPTGLALAADLARRGHAVAIFDAQAEGANTSRAAVIHARTLEALEPLGVVPDLLAAGLTVPVFRIRDRERVLLAADFSTIPSRYNYTLMCPQNRTEAILLQRFQQLGGMVTRPARVVGFAPSGDGVRVTVAEDGGQRSLDARWLVGCDGMHSTVREAAGIGFAGAAYPESFVLADVRYEGDVAEHVDLFLSPEGFLLNAALPGRHFRIVATVAAAPADPDRAFMQDLLDARGPRDPRLTLTEIVWSSRFHVHHRVADRLRAGPVLLCGDAAHVHSPAGGQGMNTGIQDAMELAAALDGATAAKLDAWAARRHAIARRVVAATDRATRMATLRAPAARALRNTGLAWAGRVPAFTRAIAYRAAGLGNRP